MLLRMVNALPKRQGLKGGPRVALKRRLSVALCASGLVSMAVTGSVQGVASAKGVQPDFSYFKGKTITYIIGEAAGQSIYNEIAPVVPVVAKKLGATINITSVTAGMSTVAEDEIAHAKPNGLTIGTENLSSEISEEVEHKPAIDFNPVTQLDYIMLLHEASFDIVACPNSPFKTFTQVLAAKTPFKVVTATNGVGQELNRVLLNAYGLPAQYVSGYQDSSLENAGCLRGDGTMILQPPADFTVQAFASKKVWPLIQTYPLPKSSEFWPYVHKAPTLASLEKRLPRTAAGKKVVKLMIQGYGVNAIGDAVSAPAGTPPAELLALREAFRAAESDPSVQKKQLGFGNTPGSIPIATGKKAVKAALENSKLIDEFFAKSGG